MNRSRSDSTFKQAEIFKQAVKQIEPPLPLQTQELPFWEAITETRPEWTKTDLMVACQLARTMWAIEHETFRLSLEGSVLTNQRGTEVMNPRHSILEQLTRRQIALMTKLHIHATATQGEAKLQASKGKVKQKAIEAFKSFENDDDLLARPN